MLAVRLQRWGLATLLVLGAGLFPSLAFAGDSLYGKITEVKNAEVVVLDYGQGTYEIRIAGVQAPKEGLLATRAKELVANLVLGKNVRVRFEGRNKAGEMVGQLQTDDPQIGIKDVGLEMVKTGMARRQPNYDYKYHELATAEREAQGAKRGLWAPSPPK